MISKYLSAQMKNKYVEFLNKYKDVFAWSYDDLKTYDTSVIEHKIPLKLGIKHFRKKLRQIKHVLLPVIEREVRSFSLQKLSFQSDILNG
jgi:hypothetical protein